VEVAREFFEETGVPLVSWVDAHSGTRAEAREGALPGRVAVRTGGSCWYDATIAPEPGPKSPMTLFPGQEAQRHCQHWSKIGFLGTDDWHQAFRGRVDPAVGLDMLHHLAGIIAPPHRPWPRCAAVAGKDLPLLEERHDGYRRLPPSRRKLALTRTSLIMLV